jgi:isoquinoline 1-oxidoreductase subunit alpha
MKVSFQLNGSAVSLDCEPDEPLLWILRDMCGDTSPKFGCGAARCGACTVMVNNQAVRSCMLLAEDLNGKNVTTLVGLSGDGDLHPLQRAWIEENVPQCGYCQTGQIMSAAALVQAIPKPSVQDIESAMSGNLCRCGTYPRIVKAIQKATGQI